MNKEVEYRLDDFIDDVINSGDDEVDIEECHSYKSLVRDLEVLEILKEYFYKDEDKVLDNYSMCIFNGPYNQKEYNKIKEWLEEK